MSRILNETSATWAREASQAELDAAKEIAKQTLEPSSAQAIIDGLVAGGDETVAGTLLDWALLDNGTSAQAFIDSLPREHALLNNILVLGAISVLPKGSVPPWYMRAVARVHPDVVIATARFAAGSARYELVLALANEAISLDTLEQIAKESPSSQMAAILAEKLMGNVSHRKPASPAHPGL